MTRRIKKSQSTPWLIGVGLGLLMLAVATLGALSNPTLTGVEQQIFRVIYQLPVWLEGPMLLFTQAGSIWMVLGLASGLGLAHRYWLALRVLLTGMLAYIVVLLLKVAVARPRPGLLLGEVLEREPTISQYGFPSGHTALAVAVSLALLPYMPKSWRWIVPAWIIIVAISRMYLGVHTPWDILGGIGVGLVIASVQIPFRRSSSSTKTS